MENGVLRPKYSLRVQLCGSNYARRKCCSKPVLNCVKQVYSEYSTGEIICFSNGSLTCASISMFASLQKICNIDGLWVFLFLISLFLYFL